MGASKVLADSFVDLTEGITAGRVQFHAHAAVDNRQAQGGDHEVAQSEGDAPKQKIDEIISHSNVWSPVANTLRNNVLVEVTSA